MLFSLSFSRITTLFDFDLTYRGFFDKKERATSFPTGSHDKKSHDNQGLPDKLSN